MSSTLSVETPAGTVHATARPADTTPSCST